MGGQMWTTKPGTVDRPAHVSGVQRVADDSL
jgi:hypothetical protein